MQKFLAVRKEMSIIFQMTWVLHKPEWHKYLPIFFFCCWPPKITYAYLLLRRNLICFYLYLFTVDNSGVRLIGPNGLLELEGRRSPRTSPQQTLLQGILNHHPGASPLLTSLQGGPNGILGPHRLPPYTSQSTGKRPLLILKSSLYIGSFALLKPYVN